MFKMIESVFGIYNSFFYTSTRLHIMCKERDEYQPPIHILPPMGATEEVPRLGLCLVAVTFDGH